MVDKLRNFDADRMDMAELVALAAFARAFRAEFEMNQVEVPSWVDSQIKSLRREITSRRADELDKQLREKRARLESLKPAEERRVELAREIERLEALASAK